MSLTITMLVTYSKRDYNCAPESMFNHRSPHFKIFSYLFPFPQPFPEMERKPGVLCLQDCKSSFHEVFPALDLILT